jgi:7-cyano-7-deazaguanine reductase
MADDERSGLHALGRGPMPPQRNLEYFAVEPTVAHIELESTELVSRCPVTGQTDFYKATIAYRPNGRALETKSLKLYLATFQQEPEGIFAEHLADRIAGDVAEATAAHGVAVTLVQNVRGGITTTVRATRGEPVDGASR